MIEVTTNLLTGKYDSGLFATYLEVLGIGEYVIIDARNIPDMDTAYKFINSIKENDFDVFCKDPTWNVGEKPHFKYMKLISFGNDELELRLFNDIDEKIISGCEYYCELDFEL